MNIILGKVTTAMAWPALRGAVSYASDAFSGHVGVQVLDATVNSFATKGKAFGPVGEFAGRCVGKAVAGQGLAATQAQVKMLGDGLRTVGLGVMNAASPTNSNQTPESTSLASRAWSVGKTAAVLAGGAAVAGGIIPATSIGLFSAATVALPKITSALTSSKSNEQQNDLVENVAVAAAKTFMTEAAALTVGNIVRYDQVKRAYHFRSQQGQQIGEIFGAYLPNCMKNLTAQAGRLAGTIDAGRYAMSNETLKQANTAAETAEQLVKAGLGIANVTTMRKMEQPSSTSWDTARKTLWIAGGVLSAAAVVVVAPEIAPFVAGTATLSVADQVITWAKSPRGHAKGEQKANPEASTEEKNSEEVDGFVVVN